MSVYEHATEFAGSRVVEWEPGTPVERPEETVYRISLPCASAKSASQCST